LEATNSTSGNDPRGLPYKFLTKKLIARKSMEGIPILGWLELIVDTLFPKHPEITWANLGPLRVFQEIKSEELTSIATKILRRKTPGQDDIPDTIVKALSIRKPGILLNLFNTCLKKGIFSSK